MNVEDFYKVTFVILCIIISLGTVGNIISVIVWSKGTRCRATVLSTYFKILATSDLFVLLVPGIDSLLKYVPGTSIQLRNTNDFLCKFVIFTVHFGLQLSEWVTVAMTVECTLALCFPVQFYRRGSKAKYAYLVFGLIALLLLNIPISLTAELVTVKKRAKTLRFCNIQKMPSSSLVTVLMYVSSIGLYIVLPAFIFIICNSVILVKLCRMRCSTSVYRILTRNTMSTAKLTVCINVVRIVTNIPVLLTFLIRFDIIELDSIDLWILSAISYGCLYLSNAINILLYWLVKKGFRQDFKMLSRRWSICCSQTFHREDSGTENQINPFEWNTQRGIKLNFQNRDRFWI